MLTEIIKEVLAEGATESESGASEHAEEGPLTGDNGSVDEPRSAAGFGATEDASAAFAAANEGGGGGGDTSTDAADAQPNDSEGAVAAESPASDGLDKTDDTPPAEMSGVEPSAPPVDAVEDMQAV